MRIPKRVARWNRAGLNRVVRHIAPSMPGLGLLVHRGRRSGREYQTPVELFPAEGGVIIALTYGPDTDWLKNIQAAGGGKLRTRGRTLRVGSPRVYRDEARTGIRPAERQVLRLLGVADFVYLKTAPLSYGHSHSNWPWPASPTSHHFSSFFHLRITFCRSETIQVPGKGPEVMQRCSGSLRGGA